MDVIDQALNKLPSNVTWIVRSFLGNPHGFTRLDADATHECLKYHHGQSWFTGPEAEQNYNHYVGGCIQQVDATAEGVDECGNSKLRTMILEQWADHEVDTICGM
eukprot:48165-Eustigmatos_ZCMA.PRE.1